MRWAWDFTVGGGDHGAVVPPIIQVDYQAGVGADNRASAGTPLAISLDVQHLSGASAPGMADTLLWYATDGSTWLAAPLRQHGSGHYTATIPASALSPGTSVSLHVRATDHGGNSIDQTLTGAVAVTS